MQGSSLACCATSTVKRVRIIEHRALLQRSISIASTYTCWCCKHAAGERRERRVEPERRVIGADKGGGTSYTRHPGRRARVAQGGRGSSQRPPWGSWDGGKAFI